MSLWSRIANVFRADRLSREIDEELQSHIEEAIEEGRDPAEARRAFGPALIRREECRDARLLVWLDSVLRDFRYGLSAVLREPAFAITAVGVLALGIGASTAMFSVVDAVILKPLPFPEPERLVGVEEGPDANHRWGASTLNFIDWQRLSKSFEALAAETPGSAVVMVGGEPARWQGELVTADYFKVLGVKAALGRTSAPGEDQPGAARVVVLSHAAWLERFGGAADILSRDLIVDGEAHRVIGVLPEGSFDRWTAVLWKPLVFTPAQRTREGVWLLVTGRLRRGVSLEQAREDMRRVGEQIAGVNPPWKKGWITGVMPIGRSQAPDRLRHAVTVAFAAVFLVLLLACSNVANLLMARGAARKKEMAVRAALGASRGRLIGQLLTESLVLCVLGGLAGVALAKLLVRAALPLLAQSLPATGEVVLDLRVLAFAGGTVLAVLLLVGLVPSLGTSSGALSAWLNQAGRGASGRAPVRRMLVVGEVAVSLVLVCGAMLMFRSLLNLQKVDGGVRIENVITTSVELPMQAYPTAESAVRFVQTLVERVGALPGVLQAAAGSEVPFGGVNETDVIFGRWSDGPLTVGLKHVDPHYFSALGIPVLSGRGISDGDRRGTPKVVVINQELARRLSRSLGVADPVGKVAHLAHGDYGTMEAQMSDVQIAGVIRSERVGNLRDADEPVVYAPIAQEPAHGAMLILRTQGEATAVMPGVREVVRQIDPRLPLGPVSTMRQVKERTFTDTKQSAWVIGAFAMVAALLAALGLYGVLAQTVTQRRREIGIRMALGAGPREILSGVLRSAAAMVAAGLAIGLAGAFALTGVMKSLLFQVSALDPIAFVIACASMTLVGLLAVFVPASRAARVDPVTTLRDEG